MKMRKLHYSKPFMLAEKFVPQEYMAACGPDTQFVRYYFQCDANTDDPRPEYDVYLETNGRAGLQIGLGLGILLGIICMENAKIGGVVVPNLKFNNLEFLNTYIKPVGNIFLNLLKFIVVPVVFLSMLEGIISMSDIKKVMSLGVRTIIFYLVTTCIAIVIGLSVAEFFRNHFELLSMTGLTYTASEGKHFMNVIADFFPSNILSPFVNANMIQIIVTSLFVGFGIIIVGKNAEPIKTLINSLVRSLFGSGKRNQVGNRR